MTGPVLPIYGTGAVVLYFVSELDFSFISNDFLVFVVKLLICSVLMTLVEYIAGWIFLHFYHNRLWDYSNRWGNIKGIICPLFSFVWLLLGLIFMLILYNPMKEFTNLIYENHYTWLILGLSFGIFITDLGYSLKLMSKIRAYAIKAKNTFDFPKLQENIRFKVSKLYNKRIGAWNEFRLRHSISQAFDNENKSEEENLKDAIDPSNND